MAAPARPTTPRARNPRGQGERLREALIDAAIELLADLADVDALSVRAVTARAGVTPTALYLHFADKEDLLTAVKERCFGELRRYVLAGEHEPAADVRAQARHMCLAYLRFADELPGHYRILFHSRREPVSAESPAADLAPAELSWPPNAAEAFGDLVRGIGRGVPADRDAVEVATMVWAGLHGFATLRRDVRHFPLPDAGDYVTRLLDAHLGPS